jgi:hypothetical protein
MTDILPIYQDTSLIDPATNFNELPSLTDLKQSEKIFEEQNEQKKILEQHHQIREQQKEKRWYHFWLGQGILALAAAGITAILLYVFNPPITQQKRRDELTSEKQNWVKVLAMCFFVFLLVLLLPEVIRLVKTMIQKKKQ